MALPISVVSKLGTELKKRRSVPEGRRLEQATLTSHLRFLRSFADNKLLTLARNLNQLQPISIRVTAKNSRST